MASFAKPLFVVLVILVAAYAAYRYAWYSGPYVLDRCESSRSAHRSQIAAALDRYACAADAHLNSEGSVERLFRTSHKLVGTLNALAELDLLYRVVTDGPKLETPNPLRSALTEVAWQ